MSDQTPRGGLRRWSQFNSRLNTFTFYVGMLSLLFAVAAFLIGGVAAGLRGEWGLAIRLLGAASLLGCVVAALGLYWRRAGRGDSVRRARSQD